MKKFDREIGIDFKNDRYKFGIFIGKEIVGYVYFRIMGGRFYIDEFII